MAIYSTKEGQTVFPNYGGGADSLSFLTKNQNGTDYRYSFNPAEMSQSEAETKFRQHLAQV